MFSMQTEAMQSFSPPTARKRKARLNTLISQAIRVKPPLPKSTSFTSNKCSIWRKKQHKIFINYYDKKTLNFSYFHLYPVLNNANSYLHWNPSNYWMNECLCIDSWEWEPPSFFVAILCIIHSSEFQPSCHLFHFSCTRAPFFTYLLLPFFNTVYRVDFFT